MNINKIDNNNLDMIEEPVDDLGPGVGGRDPALCSQLTALHVARLQADQLRWSRRQHYNNQTGPENYKSLRWWIPGASTAVFG